MRTAGPRHRKGIRVGKRGGEVADGQHAGAPGAPAGTPSGSTLPVTTFQDPGGNCGRLVFDGYLGHAVLSRVVPNSSPPVLSNDYSFVTAPQGNNLPDYSVCLWRFCPSQGTMQGFIVGHWETSYIFNPAWAYTNNGVSTQNGTGAVTNWYRKITQMPRYGVIAADFLYQASDSAWHEMGGGDYTINVCFADGHVQGIVDKYCAKILGIHGSIGGTSGQGNVGTNIQTYNDLLDILQTESEGQNPQRVRTVYGRYPIFAAPAGAGGAQWPRTSDNPEYDVAGQNVPQHITPGVPGSNPVSW